MYKAVVFDIDDTLYNYSSLNDKAILCVEKYLTERFDISHIEFMNTFEQARLETKHILGNTAACHNRMLYFQRTLEYLRLPSVGYVTEMYKLYWDFILNHMQLNEGAYETIKFCHDNSIRIGICSDLTADIQHKKISKLGIAHFVDAIVTSEEVGVEKPDSRMFTTLMNKLDVKPEESLYIGDDFEKDILGAENCGMTALWFMGLSTDKRSIKSLQEVQKILLWNLS